MPIRWRGRTAVPAIVAAGIVAIMAGSAAMGGSSTAIGVRLPDGTAIVTVPAPADGIVALRYRNSLYGTIAEERFVVADGRLELVELRAEQLAVLEEYYAIDTPAARSVGSLAWTATPARVPSVESLRVAATDRGERTLLVSGHPPIELWRFVEDSAPSVLIEVIP
jgi:hypothetical protein